MSKVQSQLKGLVGWVFSQVGTECETKIYYIALLKVKDIALAAVI